MAKCEPTTLQLVSSTSKKLQQATHPDTNLLQAARAALHALELALGEAAESNAICRTLRRAIAASETPNPPKSPSPAAVRCGVSYVFASANCAMGIQCDEPAFVTCEHCGPICL